MAKAYLIHGFAGVGKTTYAKKLENETRAVRFSPDDWMITLYGTNPPEERFQEYESRILALIWEIALQLVRVNVDIILDFGFWKRSDRDTARQKLKEAGAQVELYCITCSGDTACRRIMERTSKCGQESLVIDENAIRIFASRFEPLEPDETRIIVET